jgi:hypothetical protein
VNGGNSGGKNVLNTVYGNGGNNAQAVAAPSGNGNTKINNRTLYEKVIPVYETKYPEYKEKYGNPDLDLFKDNAKLQELFDVFEKRYPDNHYQTMKYVDVLDIILDHMHDHDLTNNIDEYIKGLRNDTVREERKKYEEVQRRKEAQAAQAAQTQIRDDGIRRGPVNLYKNPFAYNGPLTTDKYAAPW